MTESKLPANAHGIASGAPNAGPCPVIYVCPLADVLTTVDSCGASHVVTLLANVSLAPALHPLAPERHLRLQLDDISVDTPGMAAPAVDHVQRLLRFTAEWDFASPMVIHCYAGISRSTAAAFVTLCALHPEIEPATIARALRRAAPWATPNTLIVSHADEILARRGALKDAIGKLAPADPGATPRAFRLASPFG